VEGESLRLGRTWHVGMRLGGGGFGQVYEATSGDAQAAVKFVPKAPGADRELLFVDLPNAKNIVPIIDSGEHGDYWALVMPRADLSLRQHLQYAGEPLDPWEAVAIITDVVTALVSLDGRVVHRDLKPENILRLNGDWCLADFGISRYAEATTAPDTHKFAMSPPYAAPERWRNERATPATDVYAVGVMAYEALAGRRPFDGTIEELRESHLHAHPAALEDVPAALAALVDECLYKAPAARPTVANLGTRLARAAPARTPGLAQLQAANQAEARQNAEVARQESEARTDAERRADLFAAAQRSFERISDELRTAISAAAPAAEVATNRNGDWTLRLGAAQLTVHPVRAHTNGDWGGWDPPAFDVIAFAAITLSIPADRSQYEGRGAALWFGDVQTAGEFKWFETAFMVSPLVPRRGRQNPFALSPGEESAKAVWNGMAEFQVAWPFTPLVIGELDEFVDRWAGWLADAAGSRLTHPGTMPERDPGGSWRRS
jgi:hypothetical protein